MQIGQIYSNLPEVFAPIDFNFGDNANLLNVVYGEVRHPSDQKRDSHNLGKTTLLHLIDFLLLKGMSPDHFLARNKDQFENLVFFIELALNAGDYATIKRAAANPGRVCDDSPRRTRASTANAAEDQWDHPDISRDGRRALARWLARH